MTSQVTAIADVTVTKTDTPDPAQAGTNLTYVITARNNGPSTAATVVVTDTLPPTPVSCRCPRHRRPHVHHPARALDRRHADVHLGDDRGRRTADRDRHRAAA